MSNCTIFIHDGSLPSEALLKYAKGYGRESKYISSTLVTVDPLPKATRYIINSVNPGKAVKRILSEYKDAHIIDIGSENPFVQKHCSVLLKSLNMPTVTFPDVIEIMWGGFRRLCDSDMVPIRIVVRSWKPADFEEAMWCTIGDTIHTIQKFREKLKLVMDGEPTDALLPLLHELKGATDEVDDKALRLRINMEMLMETMKNKLDLFTPKLRSSWVEITMGELMQAEEKRNKIIATILEHSPSSSESKDVVCNICCFEYTTIRARVSGPCKHNLCIECYKKLRKDGVIICPFCRRDWNVC